jgi:hypothetical protein
MSYRSHSYPQSNLKQRIASQVQSPASKVAGVGSFNHLRPQYQTKSRTNVRSRNLLCAMHEYVAPLVFSCICTSVASDWITYCGCIYAQCNLFALQMVWCQHIRSKNETTITCETDQPEMRNVYKQITSIRIVEISQF